MVELLGTGKCVGDTLETMVSYAAAILVFIATLVPIIAGFALLGSLLFAIAFSSLALWLYEDWERRCSYLLFRVEKSVA